MILSSLMNQETASLTQKLVAKNLPARPKDANKGIFGKVLVVAGSENFPGAAYLVCAASYRVGVGLVTLATDNIVKIIVSRRLPEVTFLSRDEVASKISDYDVLLVGPGLGQKDQAIEFIQQLCSNYSSRIKTVIDGDGLNILSKMDNWWKRLDGEVVLTPHPGEMARLTGLSVEEVSKDRLQIAQSFAKKWYQVVVLKGANTVVVSPAGEVKISPFANPALATAGTGDVLAGAIAGMVAQGLQSFDAACVGVYIHGLAGEMVRGKIGDAGALASDLLPFLPLVFKQLSYQ